ncbi:MAG: PIN domain-containing protein [Sulfuricurvum sp.]|nr:PIN domain-containing protein [Sulfuricurvum sp.]
MKYLVDSNIIIYHLNGNKIATTFLKNNHTMCAISQITFIEVLSFEFTNNEFISTKELLDSFLLIDVTNSISMQCVKNRKIKKIKIPDNIISSTAQINDLILVTRNISDFNSLEIKLLDIFDS